MTITANALTRAAGVAAVAAGVLFIGVQIGHPQLDATSITTTNVYVRDQLKVLMAVLALVGITGMYLSQVRRNGVLGLIGYVLLAWATCSSCAASTPPPGCCPEIAEANPGYVNDVIAVDTGRGTVEGDIGALQTVIQLRGFAYLAGGLLFGIALFRAHVLARWAAVLLAVGGVAQRRSLPDAGCLLPVAGVPERRRDDRPRLLAVAQHPDGARRCNHRRSRSPRHDSSRRVMT